MYGNLSLVAPTEHKVRKCDANGLNPSTHFSCCRHKKTIPVDQAVDKKLRPRYVAISEPDPKPVKLLTNCSTFVGQSTAWDACDTQSRPKLLMLSTNRHIVKSEIGQPIASFTHTHTHTHKKKKKMQKEDGTNTKRTTFYGDHSPAAPSEDEVRKCNANVLNLFMPTHSIPSPTPGVDETKRSQWVRQ